MNNTELANFKKKLSIELETTTSDEAQLISNIVDSASAGALPAVSADDNGKVLTVSSGAWAAAQPSGGGVISIVPQFLDDVFFPLYVNTGSGISEITVDVCNVEGLTDLSMFASQTKGYVFTVMSGNNTWGIPGEYKTVVSGDIDPSQVSVSAHYIEGGNVCVVFAADSLMIIPSLDIIKQGTKTN